MERDKPTTAQQIVGFAAFLALLGGWWWLNMSFIPEPTRPTTVEDVVKFVTMPLVVLK